MFALYPERVETIDDDTVRLQKLADASFDPREVAYVEVELPELARASGYAVIQREQPQRVEIALDMQTPGLVVLSDLWDVGWNAELDGEEVPILRVNHAVRGVLAPPGSSTPVYRYASRSCRRRAALADASALVVTIWCGIVLRATRRR